MRRRLWSASAVGLALALLAVLACLVAPGARASDVYDGEAYTYDGLRQHAGLALQADPLSGGFDNAQTASLAPSQGDIDAPSSSSVNFVATNASTTLKGPFGSVGTNVLERAAAGGGPTTRVVTRGDFRRVDALERVHQLLSEVTSLEDQRRAARVVLSLYGGMGSFQDFSFSPKPGREGPRGRYLELEDQLFELATELL